HRMRHFDPARIGGETAAATKAAHPGPERHQRHIEHRMPALVLGGLGAPLQLHAVGQPADLRHLAHSETRRKGATSRSKPAGTTLPEPATITASRFSNQ